MKPRQRNIEEQGEAQQGWGPYLCKAQSMGVINPLPLDLPAIATRADDVICQLLHGPLEYAQGDITICLDVGTKALVAVNRTAWCMEIQALEGVIEIGIDEISLALPADGILKLSRDSTVTDLSIQLAQGSATLLVADTSAILKGDVTLATDCVPELGAAIFKVVTGSPIAVTAYGITAVVPAGSGTLVVLGSPPTFYLDHARMYGEAETWPEGDTVLEVQTESSYTYTRRLMEILRDLVLLGLAYYGAYMLRWDASLPSQQLIAWATTLPLVLVVQMACFLTSGAYQVRWRYGGIDDVLLIAKSMTLGTLMSACASIGLYGSNRPSLGLFVQFMMLGIILVGGSRAAYRLLRDQY